MKLNFTITAILIFISNCMVLAETYYFAAPTQGQTTENLITAIAEAQSGDVFVLTSSAGLYAFNQSILVSENIIIKADTGIMRPLLHSAVENASPLFEITQNGEVELIGLNFIGDNSNHIIDISADSNKVNTYTLIARNCIFNNAQTSAVNAGEGTFADAILFENCFFHNNSLIEFSFSNLGREASFSKIEIQSCVFTKCEKGAFSLPNNEAVQYGSVTINHCVFDSLAQGDIAKILTINGVSDLFIVNSVFSNSVNPNPYSIDANAKVDFCNFYRCSDMGIATGANCYYYNPQYDSLYFTSNQSLFNKADDSKNIGVIPWVYTSEVEDTVDTGDNPNGYENQGVWVVPTPDSTGKWESYFLKYSPNGKLKYRADKQGDVIPDFSYVGYMRGEKALPQLDVVATINPIQGDASSYIQYVIDSVIQNVSLNSMGFRGAILIKAGEYLLQNTLSIKANGIVLRGEGQAENETVLKSTSTNNGAVLLRIGASAGSLNKISASAKDITAPYIPVGANYVIIDKDHNFTEGEHIVIYQQFNNQWVSDLKMDQIPDDGDVVQWVASDYAYNFEREIRRIGSGPAGDSLIFYNPVVMALDAKYNDVRRVYKCSFNERISNSGVENMLLKSSFAGETDENHAWDAIYFDRAEQCWAQNITSKYFAFSCINVSKYARNISVTKCTSLSPKSVVTGGRRYSFNCDGQTSLFTYCYAGEGRHDYVTGARVCGPNVFSNCQSVKSSNDIGPHHRWAVGTLFDVVSSEGEMNVRDRSNYGTGHGWAGANQVLWNCSSKTAICQNPWASAKNYNIGYKGTYVDDKTFGNRPRGEWDGANVPGLNPQSLYFAQKLDRNLTLDFGLLESTGYFINDSIFQLKFNQAFDTLTVLNTENYSVSGNSGIVGSPSKVTIIDSISLNLQFTGYGILQYNSQLIILVANIKNLYGEPINGVSSSLITIPDLRPEVSMQSQEVSNANNQFVLAQTNKPGNLYLQFITQTPTSVAQMDELVNLGLGSVTRNADVNADVPISTYNLPEGYYYAYAVDTDGRISAKSTRSVTIVDVLSGARQPLISDNINLYYANERIHLHIPKLNFETAQLSIYDIQGRLVLAKTIYDSKTAFDFRTTSALYLAKIAIGGELFCKKLVINKIY